MKITSIAKLKLEPGDILVVKIERYTENAAAIIKRRANKMKSLEGREVLVIGKETTLSKISPEKNSPPALLFSNDEKRWIYSGLKRIGRKDSTASAQAGILRLLGRMGDAGWELAGLKTYSRPFTTRDL